MLIELWMKRDRMTGKLLRFKTYEVGNAVQEVNCADHRLT